MNYRLVAGTSVELEGMLVKSLGKGQALELQVSKMKVVGSCDGEVKNKKNTPKL
jgi:aspartyl/asparaginyl-tRNA synthetase